MSRAPWEGRTTPWQQQVARRMESLGRVARRKALRAHSSYQSAASKEHAQASAEQAPGGAFGCAPRSSGQTSITRCVSEQRNCQHRATRTQRGATAPLVIGTRQLGSLPEDILAGCGNVTVDDADATASGSGYSDKWLERRESKANNEMEFLIDVVREIITSSVVILGVLAIIVTMSQDLFETIEIPGIRGAPGRRRAVYRYGGIKADLVRKLLQDGTRGFFRCYVFLLFFVGAHSTEKLAPITELDAKHFGFVFDVLNYVALLFVMYLVTELIRFRATARATA